MGGLENGEAEIRKEVGCDRYFWTPSLTPRSQRSQQTIRLLLRVDQSLVDLHFTRLLTSLKSLHSPSLSASAASSASRISTATPTPRQRLQARDRLLALLLEASAVSEAEDGVAWSSRVREIIPIASPYTSGPQEVLLPVLITSTIDRFTAAEPSVQAAFGRAMFEAGGWIESVNEGLVVAATVGMGELGQIATEERVLSIVQISEWLAGDGGELTGRHEFQENADRASYLSRTRSSAGTDRALPPRTPPTTRHPTRHPFFPALLHPL